MKLSQRIIAAARTGRTDTAAERDRALADDAGNLHAALKWATEQIEDDLDPDHQAALAVARELVSKHEFKAS